MHKLLFSMGLCALLFSSIASAEDVVKWVDEQGITHFSNAQFAPAGRASEVNLHPANAMDVPDTSSLGQAGRTSGRVAVLKRTHVSNPRGFRGFDKRERGSRQRRSR